MNITLIKLYSACLICLKLRIYILRIYIYKQNVFIDLKIILVFSKIRKLITNIHYKNSIKPYVFY